MTSTISSVTQHIAQDFRLFFDGVSSLTSIHVNDLIKIWEKAQSSKEVQSKEVQSKESKDSSHSTVKSTGAKRGRKTDSGSLCDYVFQKGNKVGKACGSSVCSESTTKCKKHLESKSNSQVKPFVTQQQQQPPIQTGVRSAKLSISRNDYGNYEHKATNLVFNDGKLVCGKQVLDKVLPLNMTDIENCKRYNFKWVAEAVVKPESKEPDDDEEEIEKLVESYEEEDEEVEEEEVEEEEVEDIE